MVGIVLTLSISNASFLNHATNKISFLLPTASLPAVQQAVLGSTARFLAHSMPQRGDLCLIVAVIDDTYIMVIVAGCVAVILSLFMKRERLFDETTSNTQALELY